MQSLRSSLIRLLSIRFDSISIPESFRNYNPEHQTIVLKDDSFVLEALLLSFGRRTKFDNIRCGTELVGDRSDRDIYTISVVDQASIKKILDKDPDHAFMTFNVFQEVGPIRSSVDYKISPYKSLKRFIKSRNLCINFGEPISFSEDSKNSARRVSRRLKIDFYQNLKIVRGTPFQSRNIQAETIFSGKDFDAECRAIARKLDTTPEKVRQRARKEFYLIAANPIRNIYTMVARAAKFIIWNLFSEVKIEGIENFVLAAKKSPTVLIPMHRSHLDYILLGSILYHSRLNTPVVAAGINLNFWPIGYLLRRCGAFFIKRSGHGDLLHNLILKRYITYLLKRGHLVEFFIEGGRSRSGRMLSPKVGLLKTIVTAHNKGLRKDIQFVPISISYERLIEERVFSRENIGESKEKENLRTFFKASSIFRRKYGEVIVNFGPPISLENYFKERKSKNNIGALAHHITDAIRNQTNPTLTSIACTSLLMAPLSSLSRQELESSIIHLAKCIDLLRTVNKSIGSNTSTLTTFIDNPSRGMQEFIKSGFVQEELLDDKKIYILSRQQRILADFYRNSSLHLFIPFSFMSVSELLSGSIIEDDLKKLHHCFEHDFLLPTEAEFLGTCNSLMDQMLEAGILKKNGSNVIFTSRELGLFNPSLILSNIQSHLWVYKHLPKFPELLKNSFRDKSMRNEFLDSMQSTRKVATKYGIITQTEAISRATFESTLEAIYQLYLGEVELNPGGDPQSLLTDEILFLNQSNQVIIQFLSDLCHQNRNQYFTPTK